MGLIYLFLLYLLLFKLGKSLHSFHPVKEKEQGVCFIIILKEPLQSLAVLRVKITAKVCHEGGQVQGWSWFPHAADTGSATGVHQESLTTQSKQIRSIPQHFRHPESWKIPYHTAKLDEQTQRGHPHARHPVPDTLLAEKSCQQGRRLISSSQILLFLNPLEVGSVSFPPPNPLHSALATQRCLCQQTKKKSPHIYYAEEN